MLAKFWGAWNKNDLNMELRMSAGPNLLWRDTQIWLFLQLVGHLNIFGRKYLEQLLLGTNVENVFF